MTIYSQISSHRAMVFDEHRNECYAEAIRRMVTPDSVVLDLGAGLGVHGLLAAAAGAKRVYLVEPEPIVQIAKEVAKANKLQDRIVILEGPIEEVELPEQVDLIISVFTGNLLYSEDLLPALYCARDKYLKPGGKLLPDRAELLLAPIEAPELHAKYIGSWSEMNLGLDYSAVRRFACNEMLWLARDESKCERLGPGVVLAAVDLMSDRQADCRGVANCRIDKSGTCHGLLGWIRIRLDDQWLGTDPSGQAVHWSPVMLPFDPPLQLEVGWEVSVNLNRAAYGDWTWTIRTSDGVRRHSSFLARVNGAGLLRSLTPDNSPGLSGRGEIVLHALSMMKTGRSNREIAQALVDGNQENLPDFEAAMRFVQHLVLRYASKE